MVLVAGIGNIFLGDDGFGVEVAQRMAQRDLPGDVKVVDYGIRGLHLAFELLECDYETVILVDATQRGGTPGTVYLIEPEIRDTAAPRDDASIEAHGLTPDGVLALVASLGGRPKRVVVVGCEPSDVTDGIGLSLEVSAAVDEAISLITTQIEVAGTGEKEQRDVSRDTGADRRVH